MTKKSLVSQRSFRQQNQVRNSTSAVIKCCKISEAFSVIYNVPLYRLYSLTIKLNVLNRLNRSLVFLGDLLVFVDRKTWEI